MSVLTDEETIAFSDLIPIAEPRRKPRDVGLTEVRTPAHSLARIAGYVETLAPYLDSVKWCCGTQRLLPRRQVREINDYLHSQDIEVSSGGLIETVMPMGTKAIYQYLEESKALGFDIIEISNATVGISVEDKARIVKAVLELDMKPKPEINAWTPGDRGNLSPEKLIYEAEKLIDAGAWKIMIEEDGIFSTGNEGNSPDEWNRDIAWKLASKVPQSYLFWEASSVEINMWLINSFGADVNLFGGDEWLGYIAAFRSGAFVTKIGTFRD